MFHPLSLFIALRYLKKSRRQRFATLVSYASLLGIAVGVAVLVIVLSVMNGFEREVASHILGMTSHATVFQNGTSMQHWETIAKRIRTNPHVVGVQPFVRGSAMVNHRGRVKGVVVYGIPRETEAEVSDLARYLRGTSLDALRGTGDQVAVFLGQALAAQLRVKPADSATLIVPRWTPEAGAGAPRYQAVEVAAVFSVGMHEFDSTFVLMDLPVAAHLFDYGATVTGLRVKFDAVAGAAQYAAELQRELGGGFLAIDWSQFHRNFFQALKSQKRILFLILSLIIAVAAFNVVASMVMLVKEKRRDIAILKTQGCPSATILRCFLIQGLLLGAAGIGLGLALGAAIALRANDILQWVQEAFDVQLVKADVYYINYLPTRIEPFDLLLVGAMTITICVVATLYPAYRASQVAPVEALKYE